MAAPALLALPAPPVPAPPAQPAPAAQPAGPQVIFTPPVRYLWQWPAEQEALAQEAWEAELNDPQPRHTWKYRGSLQGQRNLTLQEV